MSLNHEEAHILQSDVTLELGAFLVTFKQSTTQIFKFLESTSEFQKCIDLLFGNCVAIEQKEDILE